MVTQTPVLEETVDCLSVKMLVQDQSSVEEMLNAHPEVINPFAHAQMVSLEIPMMRKLDVRRNNVWSMVIVQETVCVTSSSAPSPVLQVIYIWKFFEYFLDSILQKHF